MANRLKLSYFPFKGKGWIIRKAFRIGNVDFEDEIITMELWRENKHDKARFPLAQIPVLKLPSGELICQSNSLIRYAGRLAGLYPDDATYALKCDEIIDTVTEVTAKVPFSGSALPPTELPEVIKQRREEYAANVLPGYYAFWSMKLNANHGGIGFCVGADLTVADLALYQFVKNIRGGVYDHVPRDADALYPMINKFVETVEADARFAPHKF